jgi:FixJ family two-component response regulator
MNTENTTTETSADIKKKAKAKAKAKAQKVAQPKADSSKRLTPEEREAIVAAPASISNRELAEKYDTTYATILRYRSGKARVKPQMQAAGLDATVTETAKNFVVTISKAALIQRALGSLAQTLN